MYGKTKKKGKPRARAFVEGFRAQGKAMTLTELSREYRAEEQKLTKQIDTFLPYAKSLSGDSRREAYRRLACLYEMRRDVRMTADSLEHYYDKPPKKRIYHKNSGYFPTAPRRLS